MKVSMYDVEHEVAEHYGAEDLLERILRGLRATGADLERLEPEALAAVDEFHIGGRNATAHALSRMDLKGGQRVLDIGCGIGGAARYLATEFDCHVTAVDITPEYISVGAELAKMCGIGDQVCFEVASALDMPLESNSFDAAITFHVAMNIFDRPALYAEIARAMKPGAELCIYDMMKIGTAPVTFPVPWAETPGTSYLVSADEMHQLLGAAGFEIEQQEDRTASAVEFFQRVASAQSGGRPPPLGTHLLMGPNAKEKIANIKVNIEAGCIAPVLMIARRT